MDQNKFDERKKEKERERERERERVRAEESQEADQKPAAPTVVAAEAKPKWRARPEAERDSRDCCLHHLTPGAPGLKWRAVPALQGLYRASQGSFRWSGC